MEFHVSRTVRNKTGIDDLLFNYAGNVVFANLAASREFVKRYNEARAAENKTAPVLHAGSLFAMGLIDELNHAMIARYRETHDPEVLKQALAWFREKVNQDQVENLLLEFTDEFPTVSVFRELQSPSEWLDDITSSSKVETQADMPNREIAVEELLMLWLSNINPAFKRFKELFDDQPLTGKTIYPNVTSDFPTYFATRPSLGKEGSLLDVLRAPMLASPDSLSGQLAYMRDNWVEHLGPKFADVLKRAVLATGILKEEEIAIWMMYHPGAVKGGRYDAQGKWHADGFEGDEFVGFGDQFGTLDQPVAPNEYEAFSPDQAWMPTVVMIAKSTYVWLEQLSKKYQRHIYRLDQIPPEEFGVLAERGINALWLIGLWERSTASQTIKRMMGQHDAVASAYSLKDYRIADDLGGTYAYERLRDEAGKYGIRLASDMVPNHMGIDSTWVMEHPEWFLSRQESPFPVYSFEGPDLSNESRFEIKIEDHYFDQSDAAVVFRLRERNSGHTEFVYHGNDGTTFAWNDTAQLDYSKAFVREQVIQTILAVARLFPIIRFDAAMTLAKKHVQRLWFPLPGHGGCIPSRAESAVSAADFDAMMPNEFWREVVDRVAVEVPGTLLLAEAFWLLEGYFVRTLGMHRVYNSAFMNMVRDEENAKYRSYLKKTIEFDPDILKRYVNFMSNPDEKTAIAQFGTGDKYFGTCTMLATIPGLPMIGHGQIEAFTEKYGMEYKQARFEEWPNEDLVARHMREIAPLLKNRQLFAESHNFVMYDFWAGGGDVDENVFVYSNRVDHGGNGYGGSGKERALIFYNNAYQSTRGTIHVSCASMDKGSGELRQRTLSDALHLPSDPNLFLAWRDSASKLEYLQLSSDFDHHGFTLELRGYQYAVLGDWRELHASAERPWDQLAGVLHGAGVYDLEEALTKLRLRPLHDALRQVLTHEVLHDFIKASALIAPDQTDAAPATILEQAPEVETEAASSAVMDPPEVAVAADKAVIVTPGTGEIDAPGDDQPSTDSLDSIADPILDRFVQRARFFVDELNKVEPDSRALVGSAFIKRVTAAVSLGAVEDPVAAPLSAMAKKILPISHVDAAIDGTDLVWAPILASLLLSGITTSEEGSAVALFDRLDLRSALAQIFTSLGVDSQTGWRLAARVRVHLAHPAINSLSALANERLWSDSDVRWLACLSESDGATYLNKECFEEFLWWLQIPRLIASADQPSQADFPAVATLVADANAAALAAGYDLAKLQQSIAPKAETAASDLVHDVPEHTSESEESAAALIKLEPAPEVKVAGRTTK